MEKLHSRAAALLLSLVLMLGCVAPALAADQLELEPLPPEQGEEAQPAPAPQGDEPEISQQENEPPTLEGEQPDLEGEQPDLEGEQPDLEGEQPDLEGEQPNLEGEQPDLEGELETQPLAQEQLLPANEDVVYDVAALAAWLAAHAHSGGTVTLGTKITVQGYIDISRDIRAPLIIDTDAFGLVFDGGCIIADEQLQIVGAGVDMPVVEVKAAGGENFWESSWNNLLLPLNITATGRAGQGGVALRILQRDAKRFNLPEMGTRGCIRAYGAGAVGLWLDVPMQGYCYDVEVSGENACAVYAPQGAQLLFCTLSARGSGATAAAGGDVVLDTCKFAPAAVQAAVINRHVIQESIEQFYLPVPFGGEGLSQIYYLGTPQFILAGEDGEPPIPVQIPIDWDFHAVGAIALDTAGKTTISGTYPVFFDEFGLFDAVTVQLVIEVRDPALPCIDQLSVQSNGRENYIRLNFWSSFDPLDPRARLWRSDDEGATWRNVIGDKDIQWQEECFTFAYEHLSHPIMFQLELCGVGESNVATLSQQGESFFAGIGGDRTGTDRDGAGQTGNTRPSSSKGHGSNNSIDPAAQNTQESTDDTQEFFTADTTPPLHQTEQAQPDATYCEIQPAPQPKPSMYPVPELKPALGTSMAQEGAQGQNPAATTHESVPAATAPTLTESVQEHALGQPVLCTQEHAPVNVSAQSAPPARFHRGVIPALLGAACVCASLMLVLKLRFKGW